MPEKYAMNSLDGKIEWRGLGKARPVDAVGQLPRGDEFRSFGEFKEVILGNYQADMVRGIMKNLVIYGTGRKPDVSDMAEIRAVMKKLAPKGYPMRDLLKGVVRSKSFLGN